MTYSQTQLEEEEEISDDSLISLDEPNMPDLPSTVLPGVERTKHDEIGAEGGAEGVPIAEY